MPAMPLMPHQDEVVFSKARFMCYMAGRRAGKTDAIKWRMRYLTTKFPRYRYMYITPLSGQGLEVYFELVADKVFYQYVRRKKERPYPMIYLKNGSRIAFRSFQRPEGIRSTGEDEICIDESQDPKIIERKVNTVILPMIGDRTNPIDGRRGRLLLAGQFRGEDWRYKKYFLPGQDKLESGEINRRSKRPIYYSWAISSRQGYCFQTEIGKEELEIQRELCTFAEWEQEWECKARANVNAAFPSHEIDAVIKDKKLMALNEQLRHRGYCGGVDIGRIVDGTVIVIMSNTGEVVFVKSMPQGMDYGLAARECAQICAHFGASMIVDATGGARPGQPDPDKYVKLYRDAARIYNIPFREHFWGRNKNPIIENFALALHQKRITIPKHGTETLVSELRAYEYNWNEKMRTYSYNAPLGLHDDCVAAITQAWDGVENGFCPIGTGSGNLGRLLG